MTDDLLAIDRAMRDMETLLSADAGQFRGAVDSDKWLPEWFLQKLAEIEAAEAAIKEHADALLHQAATRRSALWWKWGAAFEARVRSDIDAQGGKKKSMTYATGKAGYRSVGGQPTIEIVDEDKAVAAAESACPGAVKVRKTLLKSEVLKYVQATGDELPGTRFFTPPIEERFFPKREQPLLESPCSTT